MDIQIDSLSRLDKYPAKQHAARVARALGVKEGLIYLRGASIALFEDSDQGGPFRQRRYFYYLTGCNEKNCHVTYDIATERLILWLATFTTREAIYMGRGSTIKEAQLKYDLDDAKYSDELVDYLKSWSSKAPVYVLHDEASHFPPKEVGDKHYIHDQLLDATNYCRMIKDDHEIKLIQRANDISTLAHVAVLRNIRNFTSEAQVAATFIATSMVNGAPYQAYPPIAGAGSNAAVLHYGANDQPLTDRQSMVLDAGAEYSLYSSDVTRSFPLSGHWSTEGAAIYAIVAGMQGAAMTYLGPGKYMATANLICHWKAVQGLKALGILRGSDKELFESGISKAFFPHGLGHHVGLEVHDVDYNLSARSATDLSAVIPYDFSWLAEHEHTAGFRAPCKAADTSLAPNMVVTVEPGIYFYRYSLENMYKPDKKLSKYIDWKVLEDYYAVGGVRIEDDILITKDGWRNLTTTPKGEDALRIIRGE